MQALTPAIRVLCVDDQAVIRRSLGVALMAYEDMVLVGEASSGEEALRLCADLLPDVVLMDILMPGLGGPAATRAIRERWPTIGVIGLTSYVEAALLEEMRRAGACRCITKTGCSDELMDAIRAACHAPAPPSPTG